MFTSALFLIILCLNSSLIDAKNETEDAGKPVFLSDYIDKGQIRQARQYAEVHNDDFLNVISYSGFITVNKTYNSNAYFWFFLSQVILFYLIIND